MPRNFVSITTKLAPMFLLVRKEIKKRKMDDESETAALVFYDFLKPYLHLCKYIQRIWGYVIISGLFFWNNSCREDRFGAKVRRSPTSCVWL
jgi:hypothetical protein